MARTEEGRRGRKRWFVVANGSRAQVWVQRADGPGYDRIRAWDEPDARAHDHEPGEDRPGRLFPAAGAAHRSGIERDVRDDSPKEHARRELLHAVAADLAAALRAGEAEALVLVAPAPVLKTLHDALPQDLRRAVAGEQSGDLTQLPAAALFERLDALRRGG